MRRSDKLRKALRGGFGYKVQQEAWDAVLPEWRRLLERVVSFREHPAPRTSADREQFDRLSETLRADNRFLGRAWFQLLMQAMYRKDPWLGGWFPT